VQRVADSSDLQGGRLVHVTEAIGRLEGLTETAASASRAIATASDTLVTQADEARSTVRRLERLADGASGRREDEAAQAQLDPVNLAA
jgi:cob(I)alamin adenosyltransferase